MMASMMAVSIRAYGGVDVLNYEEMPRPAAGEGEVLIRVHAAAVNPFDCAARAGYVASWFNYSFPLILGLDVSGVVEAVGAGVTTLAPGDAVYARSNPAVNGAYAEYIVLPADQVAAKPQSLDHIHAAAIPHVLLTAWAALIQGAELSEKQTVLIHGAAGGVGHMAVQLAGMRGARVIGTASDYNLAFLRELGVAEAIDYNRTPFETVVHDVDVVLDTVGGETQQRSWAVLKPGGLLLSPVQPPSEEEAAAHQARGMFVMAMQAGAGLLTEFAALVEAGQIKPVVSTVLPLSEIRRAHELIEGRHTRGKIVLQISD
jgi:NADPH:quinone reductase-like Zn-dependent oxidoreductase